MEESFRHPLNGGLKGIIDDPECSASCIAHTRSAMAGDAVGFTQNIREACVDDGLYIRRENGEIASHGGFTHEGSQGKGAA